MAHDRREFLKTLGVLSAASTIAPGFSPEAALARAATEVAGPPTLSFLTQVEHEFIEAALARLIPADELGPGAKEAGVAGFIDGQLAGGFGVMARAYRLGPWLEGTPEQGDQSALTPREMYRAAIREIDDYCDRRYGKSFAELAASEQDDVLRGLDEGTIALSSVKAPLFFGLLWGNAQEGFFADPVHGGNRDKVGWKLVGFPGVAAVYSEYIERHGEAYRADPVSIVDLQQKRVRVDEHGHPVHTRTAEAE
jgi:gluconate 2-dehydrogenase gamma chain